MYPHCYINEKFFKKTKFSNLCTPIDIVNFLLIFKGDEGGV